MRLLALALAIFVAACATVVSKPPAVTLAGVGLESLGLFEQRYVLRLRVRNPNDVDIPIEGLAFDVELNGAHFATAISNAAVRIPRRGEGLVEVPATSNLGAFLKQWRKLQGGGRESLDYRIKGSLRVSGYGELPFDHRGELALPDIDDFGGGGRRAPRPAEPKALPGSI